MSATFEIENPSRGARLGLFAILSLVMIFGHNLMSFWFFQKTAPTG